jgi:hypothetical protein
MEYNGWYDRRAIGFFTNYTLAIPGKVV